MTTERRPRPAAPTLAAPTLAALLLAPALVAGCASNPPPEPPSQAEQEVAATRAAAEATAAEAQRDLAADERRERGREPVREKIVVVDPGGRTAEPTPRELAAAARAKRARGEEGSGKRLTNENLAEIASQGKLTYADVPAVEQKAAAAGSGDAAGGDMAGGETAGAEAGDGQAAACGEICWRRRARELRQAWADTAASIDDLEARVADLRWQFYATDDPWQRDNQVKPAWDRAIDRLRHARQEAARYAERVDELMEEGRRAGALPGWLREGSELEPQRSAESAPRDPAEPVEPDIVEQTEESVEPKQEQH